jgi:hypothetical protein
MKLLQDLTETRLLLRRMVAKGYVTIEQLDHPSPGWAENAKRFRIHHPNYEQHQYRNPLRDDDQQPEPVQPVQTDPGYNPDAEFPF